MVFSGGTVYGEFSEEEIGDYRYQKYSKRIILLDTQLNDVSDHLNKTGYVKFVLKSIIARRKQIFQRWKEIVVWILYFPLYFNKHVRKYYN